MQNHTKNPSRMKPEKPYPDFPLFPHATGRWAKKVRGQMRYFGPWDNPDGALAKWKEQQDDLRAGRTPKDARGQLTIRDVVNAFIDSKTTARDKGEITHRTYQDYYGT